MKNFRKSTMIKFDDAFEIMMGSARRLGTERVDIDCALNRVLAEDVVSDIDMPPFNKSAMDGYACRRADLANELTVIETIPAGLPPKKAIAQNECAKIMTGAVVPEGADCVIMVEYTEGVAGNRIRFTGSSTTDNICLKGEDIKKGDVVLRAGRRLAAQHIAVLASHGWVKPLVSLRPRVGIIATGNELVEPGQKPTACQIRNSNGFQLAAQVENAAAIAINYGIAIDTEKAIEAKVQKAMAENDVVILSGGVSAGDYDLVREILEKNNIKLLFEKVAVKPGKPMVFGTSDEVFCFGLPGNPVSTFVMFELLVKPFLFKMMGHDFKPIVAYRQLEKTITRKKTERDSWLPVVFTSDNKVAKIEYHGSAHINALCEADGLLCIHAGASEIKEGTTVAVRQI
jgi:molybdopterin molybdotransferase